MSKKYIGQAVTRHDAHDKAMGRIKYTDDMCDKGALVIRVLHSTVANGIVKKIDTAEAEKVPGVVRIFTCFDRSSSSGYLRPPYNDRQASFLRRRYRSCSS